MGSLVVHMACWAGMLAKLARNLVQYGSWLAAYEGQRLAEASGIELAKLAEVIRASDAKIGGAATLMFRPTVAPLGPADDARLVGAMRAAAALAHKDLRAALEAGAGLGLDLPLATMTEACCDQIFGVGAAAKEAP
jgi:3-hydroxyisobutyrate dehydrogenase